jgi:hypothetical protein
LTSELDRGEYLGADGKITLECILEIQGENMGDVKDCTRHITKTYMALREEHIFRVF